jgi:hypothetical protein
MGATAIGGHFYHDAHTHAFVLGSDGWGTSSGTIIFFDRANQPHPGNLRYIRTEKEDDMKVFIRSDDFVAFPNIIINTNDTLDISERMGLDALSIRMGTGKTGVMCLRSNVNDAKDKVYDASLRVSGTGRSESLVEAGSVVVERDLSLYRIDPDPSLATPIANYPMFAFASPMKSMRSGYFAGNWVRKLLYDPAYYDHVQYVYGNRDADNDNIIDLDQYLWDPKESFEAGRGYLIKARPDNFNYDDLKSTGGLSVTGADPSLYDKGKFVFDGKIYNMKPIVQEQLFAEDTLYARSFNNADLTSTGVVNWIIGNSWTSAINADALAQMINDHPSLTFESNIYIYPAGTPTYQPYKLNAAGSIALFDNLSSIPSQSLFMIRLLKRPQDGEFALTKRVLQTHSMASHNELRSTTNYQDEILFRISPASNSNIFDLTAVGLRSGAKEIADNQDMTKMYQNNSSAFLLYSLSTDNQKLAVNAVPQGTRSVKLCLHPGDNGGRMTLRASRTESIAHAWLEDLLTHTMVNLKEQESYTFLTSPQDNPERFIVHFDHPTALDDVQDNFLQCYYDRGTLVVKGLADRDLGSSIFVVDMQGRIVKQEIVSLTPEVHIPLQLSDGLYLIRLQGNRNVTVKFKTL